MELCETTCNHFWCFIFFYFVFALFSSEYGFAEKVVEGITVSVNSIVIKIGAKAFNASFELSQLRIYSVNAHWERSDLRSTRVQDPQRGEVEGFFRNE